MSETVKWQCPSNIALVKYWGKRENQIPCNASVSMTLHKAVTQVELTLLDKTAPGIEVAYFFQGQKNEQFERRIIGYLQANEAFFPVVREFKIQINSTNSFPHSAGIASSASAFGALAIALLAASGKENDPDFLQQASRLARLGSGSASRSLFPQYAFWGRLDRKPESSDEYAVPVLEIHAELLDMRDAILIVDDQAKEVSSSRGHGLMKDHPYAKTRFNQANRHCREMLDIIKTADFDRFVSIIEREALALHAMMMTSGDYYLLMKPGTIHAIENIMRFRKETHIPVCFTLDAGPNVHVIYPGKYEDKVEEFLKAALQPQLKDIMYDRIGQGPEKIMY